MKSGNLNFLEPSGTLWACNGTALPFFTVCLSRVMCTVRFLKQGWYTQRCDSRLYTSFRLAGCKFTGRLFYIKIREHRRDRIGSSWTRSRHDSLLFKWSRFPNQPLPLILQQKQLTSVMATSHLKIVVSATETSRLANRAKQSPISYWYKPSL